MDDHTDFGSIEESGRLVSGTATAGGLYGPTAAAAAAAAVNSGLMQLPSVADTAGRLGVSNAVGGGVGVGTGVVLDGNCPHLPSGFVCPPSLYLDYSQLRGWYGQSIQNQGSSYSDMFGSYAGPSGSWRNLSTPPAVPDHFHSPLPGMTHPLWPCPPTPVPFSEGCSLSYYNPPSIYSAYFSVMPNSAASGEYSPYLSPRFPCPIPSYQQQLHDMHKAFLLANTCGSSNTSDFSSSWNPYLTGSSVGSSLASPGYMGPGGQLGFGLGIDVNLTAGKCVGEEQKQIIKQEPLPNRTKKKKVPTATLR